MRPFFIALAALFLFLVAPQGARAQSGASVSGLVTNQTGAALTDAAVTIKNLSTGELRTIPTDRTGHYRSTGLAAGNFIIRVVKKGSADETRGGITLTDGEDATVDITMVSKGADVCSSGLEFATTDCTLTWHGITLYGAYDVGVG